MKVINLGPDCRLTGILQFYKYLGPRSPFDSVITPHNSLIDCLDDKFKNFTNENEFKLYFDKQSPVNKYGIVLAHNFKVIDFKHNILNKSELFNKCKEITKLDIDDLDHAYEFYTVNNSHQIILDFDKTTLDIVKEKYNRRVNRFTDWMSSNETIFIFRQISNIKEAYEIKSCLLNNYTNNNFKLICISSNINYDKFKYCINDEHLILYNLKYTGKINENIFWCRLLFDLEYSHSYGKNFFYNKNINKLNNDFGNNIRVLINPLSFYMIADYYFGEEPDSIFNKEEINKKSLYKNKNLLTEINDYNIIAIQGGPSDATDWTFNFYDIFIKTILPNINKKIILIIGHYSLCHYLEYNDNLKYIIESDKIPLCFIQNLYMIPNWEKYTKLKAFPFGLSLKKDIMDAYTQLLISNNGFNKTKIVEHLNLSMSWDGREIFPKRPRELPKIYLNKLGKSKFMISPCGDRWDCYRHYESIGLETIPISHKGGLSSIFRDNMLYISCNIDKITETYYPDVEDNHGKKDINKMKYMVNLIDNIKLNSEYIKPNKDLIITEYYVKYIMFIISLYK